MADGVVRQDGPARSAAASEPDGLPAPRRHWAMAGLSIGVALAVLEATVANIALPQIAHDLRATPADAVWVANSYNLVVVMALLAMAAAADRIGYRRVFLIGLAIFVAASVPCAFARTLPVLAAARAIQGLGGAGLMALTSALVRFIYPADRLGRGIGLMALVVSLSAAAGPSVAAAVLALGGWPWLFLINLPLGLIVWLLSVRTLPATPRTRGSFPWPSAGLTALTAGLLFAGAKGIGPAPLPMLAAGVASGAILVRRERRTVDPLLPVDLLRLPVFALSIASSITAFSAYMLVFVALPFGLALTMHRHVVTIGLLMTCWPVAVGLTAIVSGKLADRVAPSLLGAIGLALVAAGTALLALLAPDASNADIAWRIALAGGGFGIFQAPNNRVMLSVGPRRRAGAAGGMLATARLIGMVAGATLAAVLLHAGPQRGVQACLVAGAVLALVAIGFSLGRGGQLPAAAPVPAADL